MHIHHATSVIWRWTVYYVSPVIRELFRLEVGRCCEEEDPVSTCAGMGTMAFFTPGIRGASLPRRWPHHESLRILEGFWVFSEWGVELPEWTYQWDWLSKQHLIAAVRIKRYSVSDQWGQCRKPVLWARKVMWDVHLGFEKGRYRKWSGAGYLQMDFVAFPNHQIWVVSRRNQGGHPVF